MTKPAFLNLRLANWAILLSQYHMIFTPQKAVKGQALADFLAAHPVPETSQLHEEIPDEVIEANTTEDREVWQMFFDGASRTGPDGKIVAGVGVVFVSPRNYILPHAFTLTEPCSNNVAEYNALVIGLQLAQEVGIQYLEAFGDSALIVNQVKGGFEVRHKDLIPYHEAAIKLANSFEGFYISHVFRRHNT